MAKKKKRNPKIKEEFLSDIDQAARRLNEQVLWENAVSGVFRDKDKPVEDEGDGRK